MAARRTSLARLSSTWAPRGPVLRVAGASPTPLVPAGPNKLTATFELPKLPGDLL